MNQINIFSSNLNVSCPLVALKVTEPSFVLLLITEKLPALPNSAKYLSWACSVSAVELKVVYISINNLN